MQYEFGKKEEAAKAEQEKKDAVAQAELQRQKLLRNGFMSGFLVVVLFAGVFFNQRNKIKAGKKKSDELLLNTLPAGFAEELKAKGSADAKQINVVTVLFSDFKGFTQLSETLTPKELVAEINECFSTFDHIMQRHGVEKIKTIGDAYMAVGGLPTPNTTHAADVFRHAHLSFACRHPVISRPINRFKIKYSLLFAGCLFSLLHKPSTSPRRQLQSWTH